jgi:cell fate regulator YaaT (PSP1 superfamily)
VQTVVGVRFKQAGKIYYFDPGEIQLQVEDHVIVETARGMEYGTVVIGPRQVAEEQIIQPLKPVIRRATVQDENKVSENSLKEKEAFTVCEQKIASHNLPMNLVEVEYTFDVNKIIFYFTAEGRIDFRDLVKDLASVFRTRIELRQIGVRDEAKMMGGIGCCGRPLCCSTFLGDFEQFRFAWPKNKTFR